MKKFLERLIYPYMVMDPSHSSLFPKKIQVGFIYTMGANEIRQKEMGIDPYIRLNEMILGRIFGASESIVAIDTSQFEDYTKYVSSFSVSAWEEKSKIRKEVFPLDCEKAYQMGVKFAKKTLTQNKHES
jgi:hypothetical protein